VGLYAYGAFLLLARASYAQGDSRTPAVVALVAAVVGVATMLVFAPVTHGAARVALLGIGHSVAYALGAVVLGVGVVRRLHVSVFPRRLPSAAVVSAVVGVGAWLTMRAVDPASRLATAGILAAVVAVGAGLYVLGMQALRAPVHLVRERKEISLP
jgi:putative peptidoglycan lipid II flippase